MKIKEYVPGLPIDYAEKPYSSAYTGLWAQNVSTEKGERRIVTYIPEDYFPYHKSALIFVPNGMDAEEFAKVSRWVSFAKKNSVCLIFLAPAKKWGSAEEEEPFVAAAFRQAFHTVGEYSFDQKYAVGYGTSADFVAELMAYDSRLFGGAVLFGAGDLSAKAVKNSTDLHKLPLWIVNEKGTELPRLTAYFMKRDNCIDEGLRNNWARVYNECQNQLEDPRHTTACCRIWTSSVKNAAELYKSAAWTERVYNEFLIKRYHHDHMTTTQLKVSYDLSDLGFDIVKKKLPHADFDKPQERIWAVYKPSDYDPKQSYPLVVVTHGFECTYEYSAKNSEMWKMAEQRKFIAVFTQALPNQVNYGQPRWRSGGMGKAALGGRPVDSQEAFDSEILYFRAMIEDVEKRYNVDRSRIYCTGHSNGSAMTYALSMTMGDVFAASAQIGAAIAQFDSRDEMPKDHYRMPALNVECSHDRMIDPYDTASPLYKELEWRRVENGVADDAVPSVVDNGMTITTTWRNPDGLPVVAFAYYRDSTHSYHAGAAAFMWDEFLCKYSKDENGVRYYGGIAIR